MTFCRFLGRYPWLLIRGDGLVSALCDAGGGGQACSTCLPAGTRLSPLSPSACGSGRRESWGQIPKERSVSLLSVSPGGLGLPRINEHSTTTVGLGCGWRYIGHARSRNVPNRLFQPFFCYVKVLTRKRSYRRTRYSRVAAWVEWTPGAFVV